MIREHKSAVVPQSLAAQKSYSEKDVQDQLFSDQHNKCYICEREVDTDFEIEHHQSRNNFPLRTYDWRNLYLSCNYCNDKKKDNFDNMLNPETEDIEEIIKQEYDSSSKKFIFTSAHTDEATISTIELLNRVFNGTHKILSKREEKFREKVVYSLNRFRTRVLDYINNPCDDTKQPLHESLSIDSELLGLKYLIVKSNANLNNTFATDMVWNK